SRRRRRAAPWSTCSITGRSAARSTTPVERPPGPCRKRGRERWNQASTKEDVMADEKNRETPDTTLAKARPSEMRAISGGSNGDDVTTVRLGTGARRAAARRRALHPRHD